MRLPRCASTTFARSALLLLVLLATGLLPARSTERIFAVGGRVQRPVRIAGERSEELFKALNAHDRPRGVFIIQTVIRRDGRVGTITILRPKKLTQEVETALRRDIASWRFQPATLDGRPVAVHYTLTINICPQ